MTIKQVLSFFLTGATVLSMSTAALAADPSAENAAPPRTAEESPALLLPNDVAETAWYAPAVRYVLTQGWMETARPAADVTRFEPARMASRQTVADALDRDEARYGYPYGHLPADSAAITRQEFAAALQYHCTGATGGAADGIAFCLANGLLHRNADGDFAPGGKVTRAALAQALYQLR